MEILTVLDELYHVNLGYEAIVLQQINKNLPYLCFDDGKKSIILRAQNIVSIEYYGELK